MNAIEITNLSKTYAASGKSPEKHALDHVSLTIPQGSIYGLLGPNGAGKSTIINILAGLVLKTSGSVKIWKTDIDENPRQTRSNIGIVPQELNFDPFFSPRRLLDLQAGLYGVPKSERRTEELLKLVGLLDKADAYARSLSGGMRRRLMVAKAMVHTPPILVLDEPTAGVDVELRNQLWESVKILNKQGLTILLTTHYLQEAEELCDRIAIINHGKVVADEDKETLLSRVEAKEITLRLDRDLASIPESLLRFSPQKEGKRTLAFRYSPKETNAGEIITATQQEGLGIVDLSTDDRDLEDVFLQLTKS
ncbi:MAG: ABC transporter ATP-binding protein [Alphaproteobacteria bacterium]|nr:ABC transporter ATP-binding protein [Alphaproteobacteria bacterium]MCB9985428.1 ABC transporter ATP-binding protein [Micavibrio sp.]HRK98559.1 ABC transporter ATP-binding protein [Alphaproteobacteria bacterium]